MKILYESDLAGSKYHGMAYRIYQFSQAFVEAGHEVLIVAASYSHVRKKNPTVRAAITAEVIDGIIYKWIRTNTYTGNGVGRIWHMISYNFKLWLYAKKIAKEFKPDIVIASGVTPLDFIGCKRIAQYADAKCVFEVGDLWPLTPVELGGFSKYHPFIIGIQKAEDYAYQNTDAVISLLPCAEEYMKSRGLSGGKFICIPNGIVEADWNHADDLSMEYLDILTSLRSSGKFLIGFAGTHSISNALYTLIEVAKKTEKKDVHFVLVGGGPIKEDLIKYAHKKDVKNITFLSPISKSKIPSFLHEMDALYIGFQKQSLYRFGISPNKLYDYMMSGRPIIQAIDAGNNPVGEANCGYAVAADDVDIIADAIIKMQSLSVEERNILGNNGAEYVLNKHGYKNLVEKYLNVLISLAQNKISQEA